MNELYNYAHDAAHHALFGVKRDSGHRWAAWAGRASDLTETAARLTGSALATVQDAEGRQARHRVTTTSRRRIAWTVCDLLLDAGPDDVDNVMRIYGPDGFGGYLHAVLLGDPRGFAPYLWDQDLAARLTAAARGHLGQLVDRDGYLHWTPAGDATHDLCGVRWGTEPAPTMTGHPEPPRPGGSA